MEHAGKCILPQNADNFPNTQFSYQLSSVFTYPEPRDPIEVSKTSQPLTFKEENRHTGVNINAGAKNAEYGVFKVFEHVANKPI